MGMGVMFYENLQLGGSTIWGRRIFHLIFHLDFRPLYLQTWSQQSKVLRTRLSISKEKLLVRLLKILKIKSLICLPF